MGGQAPSLSGDYAKQMAAYVQYLPQILGITNAANTPTAQSLLGASQAVSPAYSQLGLNQLNQYGLPYAQAGQDIQRSNALAGASTNAAQIAGPGAQAAQSAQTLSQQMTPDAYNNRAQAQNLVNSINLGGLSGGETAAVERSLNQSNTATGNLGLDNATNAVSNAMNFGNYMDVKRTALGNALGAANNTLTTSTNNTFNPINMALGQPAPQTATNFGTTQFNPVTTPGNQAYQMGQSTQGALNATANAQMPLQFQANMANSPMGIYQGVTSGIGNL